LQGQTQVPIKMRQSGSN